MRCDAVGADVLRDAARFARCHAALANRIEKRGLAVVDMAHECDDGRARLKGLFLRFLRFLGNLDLDLLFVVALRSILLLPLENEAVLFTELGDRIELQRLVDIGKDLKRHQIGDDLKGLDANQRGQVLDGDRGLQMDHLLAGLRLGRGIGASRQAAQREPPSPTPAPGCF